MRGPKLRIADECETHLLPHEKATTGERYTRHRHFTACVPIQFPPNENANHAESRRQVKHAFPNFIACDPFFTYPASPSPIILQYGAHRSGKRTLLELPAAGTRNLCRSRFLLPGLAHGECSLRLSPLTTEPEAFRFLMESHTARPSSMSLSGRLGRSGKAPVRPHDCRQ